MVECLFSSLAIRRIAGLDHKHLNHSAAPPHFRCASRNRIFASRCVPHYCKPSRTSAIVAQLQQFLPRFVYHRMNYLLRNFTPPNYVLRKLFWIRHVQKECFSTPWKQVTCSQVRQRCLTYLRNAVHLTYCASLDVCNKLMPPPYKNPV